MYPFSDILKSLPSVANPRLLLSGFGVWVVWQKTVNSTVHQTLQRFGGQKIATKSNQSLWFFQSSQVFPALARLLLWAQIHPEPVHIQVVPAKILLGDTVRELALTVSAPLREQKITPQESFDVWIHPDVAQHVKPYPGLNTAPRTPAFGMAPISWAGLKVDPHFDMDANLQWYFFVKPIQDRNNDTFLKRWKNFYVRLKEILDRLGIRYIYQTDNLFFKIEGLNLLKTWCLDLLNAISQAKAQDEHAHWPCIFCAADIDGQSFNDELPAKIAINWDQLAPDVPHLPLGAALLLREDVEVSFLESTGSLTMKSLCRVNIAASAQRKEQALQFPSSRLLISGNMTPCFYCGMKSHHPSHCPSRQMYNADPAIWDTIGSMDFQDMSKAVTDLDQSIDAKTLVSSPDLVMQQSPEILLLRAVLEINCPFQHRMLRLVWRSRGKEFPDGLRQLSPPEGEYVWAAMENMRNKNYAQAERMMQQAILRASKNYQPHILLGFIALETDNARKAESHWQNALSLCYTSLQQTYLVLLKARLKEVQGVYDQAHGLYREAHGHSSKWLEPRYRQAVSITKKGFLDQAWMVFAELIAEDPHYFNRILIDPELERGRSFFLSSLARPWSQSRRQAAKEKEEMGKLSQKLETWFEPEHPFRQDVMESLQNLQDKSNIENYVAFAKTTRVMTRLHKETEQKIKEAIATTRLTIHKGIERLRLLHAEIAYFPFPRLIRRTKQNFNKAGKILHGLSKMDLQVGSVYKKAREQLNEADQILEKLESRLKSIKILRDATLFVLLVGKSFLWLSILALIASMVAVPVMLHSMQSSGSEWATEWLTTQRWQVQRTVSLIMVFISGVVAAVWTSLRFEKQKNKYLRKKMKNRK